MSTLDVPGAKSENRDELAMGCWAEHSDGSMIFVESVEGGKVIYCVFDMSKDPIVQYRDAMNESAFKKQYTYDAKKKKAIKWTWHDKTPFPWDKIVDAGADDGQGFASAGGLISAAAQVANSRKMHGQDTDPKDYEHLTAKEVVTIVKDTLQNAINKLGL